MITRQCVCRAETHARDLWSAANKPGSCSVVVSNPPCGSSGLYFCPAYLWDSERARRREKKKITSFLVGAIKALLSSILIRVLMLCLSPGFLCLLKGYVYSADPALEVQPWTEMQQEKTIAVVTLTIFLQSDWKVALATSVKLLPWFSLTVSPNVTPTWGHHA